MQPGDFGGQGLEAYISSATDSAGNKRELTQPLRLVVSADKQLLAFPINYIQVENSALRLCLFESEICDSIAILASIRLRDSVSTLRFFFFLAFVREILFRPPDSHRPTERGPRVVVLGD